MAIYPDVQDLLDASSTGNTLLEIRRSIRSIFSLLIVTIISFVVVLFLTINFYESAFPFRLLMVIPIGLSLEIARRLYNNVFVLERDRVTLYSGRFSLRYSVPSVRYNDLRAIDVQQDIWGRMLDYGDVELGTPGHDDYEVIVPGIAAPHELALLIDKLRSHGKTLQTTADSAGGELAPILSED